VKDEADKLRVALDLYRSGDLPRAQMLLETIEPDELDPALHLETNYLWGLVLARRGDSLEAAMRFQMCVKLDPRFFPALDAWGNVLASSGDARGAIDKYKRALAVAPKDQGAHVLYNYGQVLLKSGFALRALDKFRQSYKRQADPETAYMAGACFMELGRPHGAHKWMQRALDADPRSARNLVGLGNAMLALGQTDAAIVQYRTALSIDAGFAPAHYNWALALAAQGEYAKAARQCKHGLRVDPDRFELLAHQAYCLRQMGAYDAALHAVKRMRQVLQRLGAAERKAEFLDVATVNEAACLRALGRAQQARSRLLEQLRRARDASPQSLAALRAQDTRRLRGAHRFELTVNVRISPADVGDDGGPRRYQRTYWVIARDAKDARRLVRELEPPDAEVRFEPKAAVGERLAEADRGVTERGPAFPAD
jgi:tetratricopeptide (TPR) repeat protein